MNVAEVKQNAMADVPSSVTRSDEVDAIGDGIFGLVNVSAICWFNSLIQAIMSAQCVVSKIRDEFIEMSQDSHDNVLGAFGRLIADTRFIGDSNRIHNASSILVALMKTVKNFGHTQEDAQEGFHLLLDAMPSSVSRMFESSWRVDLYCDFCRAIVSTHTREETMPLVIMERDFIPLVTTGDPFVQFMSGHMTPVTGYKCPKCPKCSKCPKSNTARASGDESVNKTMRIARLVKPADVLVVSFNKYIEKWQGPEYPREMCVSYKATDAAATARYELIAVVRHMGNMHGGHYNALCRRGVSVIMADDACIAKVDWKQGPEDYMLFYARK